MIITHDAPSVNLRSTYSKTYFVPSTPPGEKRRVAAIGYFGAGTLRSVRTSSGRRYDGDELAILQCVLDEAAADGFSNLEIVVTYRKTNTQTTYATTIEYLRQHGRRVLGVSGMEMAMPRCMWSIDGAAPTGPQPQPAPVAVPEQPAPEQPTLFAMSAERRMGGY